MKIKINGFLEDFCEMTEVFTETFKESLNMICKITQITAVCFIGSKQFVIEGEKFSEEIKSL